MRNTKVKYFCSMSDAFGQNPTVIRQSSGYLTQIWAKSPHFRQN